MRQILVTSALPYANGPIHLGHLVEYIQTDIWARFQKLRGHRCVYICADDTHGTAITIRAHKEGRSEEEFIAEMSQAHQRDFAGFDIEFDHYGSTHSHENRQTCEEIWAALRANGMIAEREVEQFFDPEKGMFLADRQVRGTCPKCGSEDQPGDNCDSCNRTYSATELKQPKSVLSGLTPEIRRCPHLFFEVEKHHDFLAEWTQSGTLPRESANYLNHYFLNQKDEDSGELKRKALEDWDLSRPGPYFGFEIPDSPGNYWYVWFDAPIGYIGSTKQWCDAQGESFDDWWRSDKTELHHFIGKDIQYFHTLFWPAMLKTAKFNLPTKVHIHGFLTVDGKKMSKSRGTFVTAEKYLEHLDPSYLRYYYASKFSSKVEDLDLGLEEFVAKVNGDLVGKIVNLASRSAGFVKHCGLAETYPEDGGLFEDFAREGEAIARNYEDGDFNRAIRRIMDLADRANPYVEQKAPWDLKKAGKQTELQEVATVTLNLFRQLAIYLAPVLPRLAQQCGELLGAPITSWQQAQEPLVGVPVGKFKHMMQRVGRKKVDAMIEESREEDATEWTDSGEWLEADPIAEEIGYDDFVKVDLRVARVVAAEEIPEARKLLRLTVSLGGNERRTVIAGVKSAYVAKDLVGRLVVVAANLADREMKFGISQGMVVAAGPGGKDIFLLSPDQGAAPGQRVR